MKQLDLSQKQKEQIEIFKKSLFESSKKINLVSRKNFKEQTADLLQGGLHSAFLLESVMRKSPDQVLDIGSGNGFPGLIFSILYPETRFLLCDRQRKKCEFLKSVVFKLALKNVEILCKNAEDTGLVFKKIFSQATGPIEEVLKILDKILDKEEGQAFFWKNASWPQNWPKNTHFIAEVFKSYEFNNSKKILLKIEISKP